VIGAGPGDPSASTHGGLLDDELAALGIAHDMVLDLSVNVNPYGPSPAMARALATARIDRYPDPNAATARRAVAARADVPVERVALGNGAVDLIWTLARAVLRPGDRVLVIAPTFSEMRTAAGRAGGEVVVHRTRSEDDFAIDLARLDAALHVLAPRLVYACAPQNPAGVHTPLAAFEDLAARHARALFAIDVSFLSLSTGHAELDEARAPNVVWLRSLTKDHALPGLRVGAAIAPAAVVSALDRERPPWSVNALAQAAAVAATTDEADRFVAASRARLLSDCTALGASLRALGLAVHPSETIFALVDLGARRWATDLRRRLLANHRVLVRDCTSFGLPHHVRIAARGTSERDRLVTALAGELAV